MNDIGLELLTTALTYSAVTVLLNVTLQRLDYELLSCNVFPGPSTHKGRCHIFPYFHISSVFIVLLG
jgi:hypothetical protein